MSRYSGFLYQVSHEGNLGPMVVDLGARTERSSQKTRACCKKINGTPRGVSVKGADRPLDMYLMCMPLATRPYYLLLLSGGTAT
jgi:hypothetical protein